MSGPSTSGDPELARIEAVVASRLLGIAHEPRRIGRYVPQGRLGAGGMGVVYSAYDDRLDRQVAIKLVHAEQATAALRRRLQREAQALAQVVHEHVVRIYETGEDRGRPFIVMEHVRGQTLRAWIRDAQPSWRERIERYRDAGRGLAAAHARGLVHRDFKPDNVLLGDDGRVRVLDFGLARAHEDTDDDDDDALAGPRDRSPWTTALTRTGARLGTPAYMAPEQRAGGIVGPAADQFSFCVALFEALWGFRPVGDDGLARPVAELQARARAPEELRELPRPVLRVLLRGLATEPDARWPTMDALLDALARDVGWWRRRRRPLAVLAVTGVLIGAGSIGLTELTRRRAIDACEREADLGALWNDDARAAIPIADDATRRRVIAGLDGYAQAWSERRDQRCLAATVERTQGEETLERGRWCLDERRLAFAALIEQLQRPSPELNLRAIPAVLALPRLQTCDSDELLARRPPPPPELREQVAGVRTGIARADASARAGRFEAAVDEARRSVAEASALAWPPVSAAAHEALGRALQRDGRFTEAEVELSTAYFEAHDGGALEIAASSGTELAYLVGVELARGDEGLAWARHALAAIRAMGDADGLVTARWFARIAELQVALLQFRGAIVSCEQALAILHRVVGPDHPETGDAEYALALAYEYGDESLRRRHAERALAIAEAALGPEHPDLVDRLLVLARLVPDPGGLPHAERAMALARRSHGPDHPAVARALVVLGRILFWRDGGVVARPLIERALAIQQATLGASHADLARTVNLLGMVTAPAPESIEHYHRSLAIAEAQLGPLHPFVAPPLFNLGEAAAMRGDFASARRLLDRGAEVRRHTYGADDARYASYVGRRAMAERCDGDAAAARDSFDVIAAIGARYPITDHEDVGLLIAGADAALRTDDLALAHDEIERALVAAEHCEPARTGYADWLPWAWSVQAQVLWALPADQGRDRERARARMHDAIAQLRAPGARTPDDQCTTPEREVKRLEAWLRAHP